ncbi:hypothetical protein HDV05_007178 [Chytridiales sp. JEL 0842]|nr:hypothetical protein HDV05_007178 [Chytridiales sp. JEL 0842]
MIMGARYDTLGMPYTLYKYEARFNLSLCLWRQTLIDEAAQELAEARAEAIEPQHLESFEKVMQGGFDPPGLFDFPVGLLFGPPLSSLASPHGARSPNSADFAAFASLANSNNNHASTSSFDPYAVNNSDSAPSTLFRPSLPDDSTSSAPSTLFRTLDKTSSTPEPPSTTILPPTETPSTLGRSFMNAFRTFFAPSSRNRSSNSTSSNISASVADFNTVRNSLMMSYSRATSVYNLENDRESRVTVDEGDVMRSSSVYSLGLSVGTPENLAEEEDEEEAEVDLGSMVTTGSPPQYLLRPAETSNQLKELQNTVANAEAKERELKALLAARRQGRNKANELTPLAPPTTAISKEPNTDSSSSTSPSAPNIDSSTPPSAPNIGTSPPSSAPKTDSSTLEKEAHAELLEALKAAEAYRDSWTFTSDGRISILPGLETKESRRVESLLLKLSDVALGKGRESLGVTLGWPAKHLEANETFLEAIKEELSTAGTTPQLPDLQVDETASLQSRDTITTNMGTSKLLTPRHFDDDHPQDIQLMSAPATVVYPNLQIHTSPSTHAGGLRGPVSALSQSTLQYSASFSSGQSRYNRPPPPPMAAAVGLSRSSSSIVGRSYLKPQDLATASYLAAHHPRKTSASHAINNGPTSPSSITSVSSDATIVHNYASDSPSSVKGKPGLSITISARSTSLGTTSVPLSSRPSMLMKTYHQLSSAASSSSSTPTTALNSSSTHSISSSSLLSPVSPSSKSKKSLTPSGMSKTRSLSSPGVTSPNTPRLASTIYSPRSGPTSPTTPKLKSPTNSIGSTSLVSPKEKNEGEETIEGLVTILDGLGKKQNDFLAYADYLVALEEMLSVNRKPSEKSRASFYMAPTAALIEEENEDYVTDATVDDYLGFRVMSVKSFHGNGNTSGADVISMYKNPSIMNGKAPATATSSPGVWKRNMEISAPIRPGTSSVDSSKAVGTMHSKLTDYFKSKGPTSHFMKRIFDTMSKNPDKPSQQADSVAADASEILKGLRLPDIESFLQVRVDEKFKKPPSAVKQRRPSAPAVANGLAIEPSAPLQRGTWKQRWCILREGVLYIVKSPADLTLIAVLELDPLTQVLPDPGLGPTSKARFGFKVVSITEHPQNFKGGVDAGEVEAIPEVHFATEDQLLMIRWVKALVKTVKGETDTGPRFLIPIQKDEGEEGKEGEMTPGSSMPLNTSPSRLRSASAPSPTFGS